MTYEEYIQRAKDGEVIGHGVKQVPALVMRILQLEAEQIQWMAIAWPVDEWLSGRLSLEEMRASVVTAIHGQTEEAKSVRAQINERTIQTRV